MCAVSPVSAGREAVRPWGGGSPPALRRGRGQRPWRRRGAGGRGPLGREEASQRQRGAWGCEGNVTGEVWGGGGGDDPAATLPSPTPLAGSGGRGGTEPRTRRRAARAAGLSRAARRGEGSLARSSRCLGASGREGEPTGFPDEILQPLSSRCRDNPPLRSDCGV